MDNQSELDLFRKMFERKQQAEILDFPNFKKPSSINELKERFLFIQKQDNAIMKPLKVAQYIFENVKVVKINGRVAIYNLDRGIYELNFDFFHKFIFWIEPSFSETKSNQVIFHLKNMSESVNETMNPYLIPVKNGIYNKQSKKLEPFSDDYYFTSAVETEYKEDALAPNIDGWNVDDWLLELMGEDVELVDLLWQVISASLNGSYSYRKSIWFVGDGNDGKGTVQQLISNIVGLNNVASLKIDKFSERFTLSLIEGKTVIIGDDVQAGIYIDDSSNFNSVVTGDPVYVEYKHMDGFTTSFKKTVIQSTNAIPKVRNKSHGTYRRFLIIPFKKSFKKSEDNWSIKDDYIAREDVLQYVLKKAIELEFERFNEPLAALVEMDKFKEKNNTILEFVNEWFHQFVSEALPVRFLWWLYQQWCKDSGYNSLAKRKFENELPKFIPSYWTRTRTRVKNKFKVNTDAPDYFQNRFIWTIGDDEKTTVAYVKE
jgi:putative DNA primase/helicase